MIPTQLILRNFLPYRGEVALDLRTIRVACIAGDNGSGKSSLLDAITWALWGKARGGAERDLMSLGTTEMGVDYQFFLGDQEYRVLRRRRRRGASADVAQLEVQLRDAADDEGPWKAITGDTLSQTQRLLNQIVGMEYDTFINSAFILQGRADEFTTKGPTDRKQVLADILGLGRYDELEGQARTLRRDAEQRLKAIDSKLEQIEQELAGRADAEARLIAVSTQLQALFHSTTTLTEQYEQVRAQREDLVRQAAAAHESDQRIADLNREVEQLSTRIATTEQRIADLRQVLATAAETRVGYQQLQTALQQESAANAALAQLNSYQQQLRQAEKQVDAQRNLLLQEQHAQEHKIADLRQQQAALPMLEEKYAGVSKRVSEGEAAEAARAKLNTQITTATEQIGGCRAANEQLKKEMYRIKGLQSQMDEAGAVCPMCRRPVDEQERQRIHDEYQHDGLRLKDEYVANGQQIADLEALIADCNRQLTAAIAIARRGVSANGEAGDLRRQLITARDAGVTVLTVERDLRVLAEKLARGDFAPEAQATVVELTAAIAAIAYDAAAHQRVQEQVAALRPFDGQSRQLERAEEAIGPEEQRHTEYLTDYASRERSRNEEVARAAELHRGLEQLPALDNQFERLTYDLDQQRRQQDELTRTQGRLEENLRRYADLDDEGRQLREDRATVSETESAYRELARAFGKSGIQAMIIETAVPEIQDEANAILANMPGSSMRVEFRTQRENRKGDTVEALEIIIGDEAGQRDYAMYSGGEAFRINFAIRVALAKLLARRAGAKLQMLVIDEGFGTQDARGRDSLVEAIRSIEGEFATILVITHVQELRELFPTQIVVEKSPAGAQISVA